MYIVGIDIAKHFHEAAIIDSNGKVIVKRIRFANSHDGCLKLMDAVRKLDAPAEFGMEATGHYRLCSRYQPSAIRRLAQHVPAPNKERHHRRANRC